MFLVKNSKWSKIVKKIDGRKLKGISQLTLMQPIENQPTDDAKKVNLKVGTLPELPDKSKGKPALKLVVEIQ